MVIVSELIKITLTAQGIYQIIFEVCHNFFCLFSSNFNLFALKTECIGLSRQPQNINSEFRRVRNLDSLCNLQVIFRGLRVNFLRTRVGMKTKFEN